MQVSVETTGPLERRMKVEVPPERIEHEVQTRLRNLSRKTRLDGFRPGKVPIGLVRKRYGPQVRREVVGEVVQSSFREAVTQHRLRPAGHPTIAPLNDDPDKGLSYTATFEIYPEFKVGAVEEIKFEKPVCTVADEDVDNMVEVLRKQQRKLEKVDRPAQLGDVLKIDFTGTVNGRIFEGSEANGFEIELGSKRALKDFEEGLVGASASDELTLDLKLPDDYRNKDVAGKPAQFKIKVHQVSEPILPEVDESLFNAFGVAEGGLEKFREEVRKNMEREADQTIKNRVKHEIMDALFAANPIDLPKALVDSEAQSLLIEMQNAMKQQGASNESYENLQPAMFTEQAQRRVALKLILGEIIQNNNLKPDAGRVRAAVEGIAASYADPSVVINWYYSDRTRLTEVESAVLEEEVVNWILDRAQVNEVETAFDALMNKGQTDVG
ncbi:MAG: trigger factor [Gammaproteobacteria bacterium]